MELRKNLKKMYFFSKIFKSSRLRMFGLGIFMWLVVFFAFSTTMGAGKYAYDVGGYSARRYCNKQRYY